MSIQSMIDAAPPGGTVNVAPGTYNEQLLIDKPLTLLGPNPSMGAAIVDAAGMTTDPTLLITSSQVTVKLMTFQNGPGQGIRIGTNDFPNLEGVLIDGCIIQGHDLAGIMNINSSAIDVTNNQILNNGNIVSFQRVGVFLYPHGPTNIINNTFDNNGDEVFARASSTGLLIEGNTMTNGFSSGITLAWDEQNVTIKNNTIKNCGLDSDDLKGGIVIVQSMAEIISGNIMENCRQRGIMWVWLPTAGPEPDEVLIDSNQIRQSSHDGVYLFSQGPGSFMPPDRYALKPLVTGNLIENNVGAGVFVGNAYLGYPTGTANPHLDCNSIHGNGWGVINQRAAVINAVNNWWGDSSGPYHPTENPEGMGNPVSDNVDFIPWCTSPPLPLITEIDCINATKVYWGCKKYLVNKEVADVSGIAEGEVVEARCLKVKLVNDPEYPVTVKKIPGKDQVKVGFYFVYSVLFKDSAGWKVMTSPPIFQGEVFVAPPMVQDRRIDLTANIYLECLECFVSGTKLVTCCIGKLILLYLVSLVQLMVPTYGFSPEPGDCVEANNKCSDFNPLYPLHSSR